MYQSTPPPTAAAEPETNDKVQESALRIFFTRDFFARKDFRDCLSSLKDDYNKNFAHLRNEIITLQQESIVRGQSISYHLQVQRTQSQRLDKLEGMCSKIQQGLDKIETTVSTKFSMLEQRLNAYEEIGPALESQKQSLDAFKLQYHQDRNKDLEVTTRLETDIINASKPTEMAADHLKNHGDRLDKAEKELANLIDAARQAEKHEEQIKQPTHGAAAVCPAQIKLLNYLVDHQDGLEEFIQRVNQHAPELSATEQNDSTLQPTASPSIDASVEGVLDAINPPKPQSTSVIAVMRPEKAKGIETRRLSKDGTSVELRDSASEVQKARARKLKRSFSIYDKKHKEKESESDVQLIWSFIKSVKDRRLALKIQRTLHRSYPQLVMLNSAAAGQDGASKIVTISQGLKWTQVRETIYRSKVSSFSPT